MSPIKCCLVWFLFAVALDGESVEKAILRDIREGEYDRALQRVQEALGELPAEAEPRGRLEELRARCLYEMGDYVACESALRRLLAKGLSSPALARDFETKLARVLYLQGAHGEATELLERSLRTGSWPGARRLLVRIFLERRRYAEARPHIEVLVADRPDDSFALFARGTAAAKMGDYRAALADLKRSAESCPLTF